MSDELRVLAPYDQSLIKTLPLQGWPEIEKMLATADQLSRTKPLPLPERVQILEKTISLLETRKGKFAKEAAEEGGKPLVDSQVELDRAIQGIGVAIESMGLLRGEEITMGVTQSSLHRLAFTLREPIGVVAAVSAFNHPFNLIVHQVVPAVITGCPVIVKPAGTTPISCFNLVKTLYEAGLPEEWCQVAICDIPNAERLVTDPRVRFLSFIGSAKVGWHLRAKIAPGTRCALEHGGAAPVIIEADADMEDMIPLLVKGGFYHAGQVCVSVQRIFAHEKVCNEVGEQIAAAAKKLKVGNPTQADTEVGPLIQPRENDRVATWVKEAVDAGAKVLSGGKKISDSCYEPTVLLNPPADAKVSREEIFGPVVCIYSYADRDEAIGRANDVPFSFQAAVFTKNIDAALDTAKRLQAAAVMVNDHTAFRVDWMPFAGHRQSGLGTGGIPYTMKDYTEEKMIVMRSSVL